MTYDENWLPHQKALYWDKQGDWNKAHDQIDHLSSPEASHVHAYLHRKEGDEWNAQYWYNRARKPVFEGNLENEWEELWGLYGGE